MNLFWNSKTRNIVLRLFQHLPIRKGRVMCVCWGGESFGCNPAAIAKELLGHSKFEVCFAFNDLSRYKASVSSQILAVQIGSFDYFKLLATSQFVISNTRLAGGLFWPFPKRKGQFYIQTMHGGHGIKKVEWDVADKLPSDYLEVAEKDRMATDLMLSDSDYWTRVYRDAFKYEGEVLEKGLPRNDVFFSSNSIAQDPKYLIYAPTFRDNGRQDVYGFNFDAVISALETRFGGKWFIRISSHPNMLSYYKALYDFSHPRLIDVGDQDLQTLLLSSHAMITDYSSTEMDFSLTGRPVFQLCKDRAEFNRGFYINPEDLPFPYAETDDQLVQNILDFDEQRYKISLDTFNRHVIGLHETGSASEAVTGWMLSKVK